MVQQLEPRYKIPSRTHFANKVIPDLYKEVRKEIEDKLHHATSIAITTDGWTSRATESFITITAHHINDNWEMENHVLQTRPLHESHTGVNIGEVLRAAVGEWKLDRPSGIACVTDNAANMDIAIREAGLKYAVKCFAHTVNLASQKGLQVSGVPTLLARVRKIVGFFHRSTTANAALQTKQKMLTLPSHKLIQDVSTRWNSSYAMMERYLEQQPAILAILVGREFRKTEKDLNLSENDISNIEDLVTVLKPLSIITTILCDEKNPTISLIHPMKQRILEMMKPCENDSSLIQKVKTAIIGDIGTRYSGMEDFLIMAAALDPRFKSLPNLSDQRKQHLYSQMVSECIQLNNLAQTQVKVKVEPNQDETVQPNLPELHDLSEPNISNSAVAEIKTEPTTMQKPSALDDLFGDVFITSVSPAISVTTLIEEEVLAYKQEQCISLTAGALQWWKEKSYKYPKLAVMAKVYLCIPGTSVPSERIFSTAGDIVSAQRASLSSDHVDHLIFLKKT